MNLLINFKKPWTLKRWPWPNDQFIKGLETQIRALEETIKVFNKMLSSTANKADATTGEISKQISSQTP